MRLAAVIIHIGSRGGAICRGLRRIKMGWLWLPCHDLKPFAQDPYVLTLSPSVSPAIDLMVPNQGRLIVT